MPVEMSLNTQPGPTARVRIENRDVLPDQVVARLSDIYDIGAWLEWMRTPKGSSNVSFFVTSTTGEYVLRRSNAHKSEESIRFELKLIDHLAERNYRVPKVVSTRSGEGYVMHESTIYMMTELIRGQSYDAQRYAHFLEAGRWLGLYHKLVSDFPGPYVRWTNPTISTIGPSSIKRLREADLLIRRILGAEEYKRYGETRSYLEDQFLDVHKQLDKVLPTQSTLVTQGSFGRSALLFDGDILAGVVDYDRAHLDIRGADLAYTLKAFCRVYDENNKDYRIGLRGSCCRAFLEAYQEMEPLPQSDVYQLPLIFRAQRLVKVEVKCRNLINKNAVIPQKEKDIRKLVTIYEKEALRLRWLEEHEQSLREALI